MAGRQSSSRQYTEIQAALTISVNSQLVGTLTPIARPQFLERSVRETIVFMERQWEVQRTLRRMGIEWKLEKTPELEIRVGLSDCIYVFLISALDPPVFIDINVFLAVVEGPWCQFTSRFPPFLNSFYPTAPPPHSPSPGFRSSGCVVLRAL